MTRSVFSVSCAFVLVAVGLLLLACCRGAPPRNLDELSVVDRTYVDPITKEPYSGPVFRAFAADEGKHQVEAELMDGTWNGELTVYYESGRIRYQGEMANGSQCGAWTQHDAPEPPEDPYEAIKDELEAIVMYPACPGS